MITLKVIFEKGKKDKTNLVSSVWELFDERSEPKIKAFGRD